MITPHSLRTPPIHAEAIKMITSTIKVITSTSDKKLENVRIIIAIFT